MKKSKWVKLGIPVAAIALAAGVVGATLIVRDAADKTDKENAAKDLIKLPLANVRGSSEAMSQSAKFASQDSMMYSPTTYKLSDNLGDAPPTGAAFKITVPNFRGAVDDVASAFGVRQPPICKDADLDNFAYETCSVVTDSISIEGSNVGYVAWNMYSARADKPVGVDSVDPNDTVSTRAVPGPDYAAQVCPPVCGDVAPEPYVEPPKPTNLPSDEQAISLSRQTLDDAGYDVASGSFKTTRDDYGVTAIFAPQIEGLTISGFDSIFRYVGDAKLESAYGSIFGVERLGDYPLADYVTAFNRSSESALVASSRMQTLDAPNVGCAVAPDGGCEMPTYMQESREILLTKVELGLSVEYQQNDPNIASAQIPDIYIVPAFHFTNDANDELWVSAVSNDYVQATVEQPAVADGDYGVEPHKIGPPDGINSPGSPPIAGSDVPPVEPAHLTTTLAPPTTTVR